MLLPSAGPVVVDDRGYNDYRLFAYWTQAGVFFVTRMKDNALFEVLDERAIPQNRNIVRDQTIRLTGVGAQDKCAHRLRRIEALREDTGTLDELAQSALANASSGEGLDTGRLTMLPGAVRRRVIRGWLLAGGATDLTDKQIRGVDALVTDWRGQGGVAGREDRLASLQRRQQRQQAVDAVVVPVDERLVQEQR